MSEANTPFNRSDHPEEFVNSSPDGQQDSLVNPFNDEILEKTGGGRAAEVVGVEAGGESASLADVHSETMSDSSVAAQVPPFPADSVTITPGAENWINSSEPTDLADLISLIQELNQCNSILLDRVSQLEEALERSQNALKAEVKRSQQGYSAAFADYNPDELVSVQDLTAAQEQIVNLYNQLEFVHQTSQRQQILVETLTGELEASQERVAHLEREAALVQQRYNEQSQLLSQYESNCRDLQARLQRQQRYTLQFKAALEKSLEVPAPRYESVAEAVAAAAPSESSFLPKVQQIQPWTAQEECSATRFPWMRLSSDEASEEPQSPWQSMVEAEVQPRSRVAPQPQPHSKIAAVKLPGFGNPLPQFSTQEPAEAPKAEPKANSSAAPSPELSSGVSYNLKQKATEAARAAELSDEKLMQKLDAAVQPLADMLAQVMLSDSSSTDSVNSVNRCAPESSSARAMDTSETTEPDVWAIDQNPSEPSSSNSSADDLLNSVMADAEDALWQDLARLIDVSTEDVVKASLSGDVSAFESINFEALKGERLNSTPEDMTQEWLTPPDDEVSDLHSTQSAVSVDQPEPIATGRKSVPSSTPSPSTQAAPASTFGSNPSWPAPLVYPLRPAKKRRSLAAVDLPSFLNREPGPLPT